MCTSLQTHRSSNGYFGLTFPTTKLTFFISHSLSLLPNPQQLKQGSSSADQKSSVHRFLFPMRPKFSPSICLHARSCWVLFWYFLFFPCSSTSIFLHSLCCVYWSCWVQFIDGYCFSIFLHFHARNIERVFLYLFSREILKFVDGYLELALCEEDFSAILGLQSLKSVINKIVCFCFKEKKEIILMYFVWFFFFFG